MRNYSKIAFASVVCCMLALVAGCTSYKPNSSVGERVVERYEQNIILESDSCSCAIVKSVKHGLSDVLTLFFAEFWYARVRSTYADEMRRRSWEEDRKRQRKRQEERQKEERRERIERERREMKRKDPILLEEVIGIKSNILVSPRMKELGLWPQRAGKFDRYEFFYPDEYRDGTVPGLRTLCGLKVKTIGVDHDTGRFKGVYMSDRHDVSKEYIAEVLHTLKAVLRTEREPKYDTSDTEKKWSWHVKTKDGRLICLEFIISLDTSITGRYLNLPRHIVAIAVLDLTDSYNAAMPTVRADAITLQRNAVQRLQGPQGAVSNLYNSVKSYLCIVKAKTSSGSGFIAKDGNSIYFYTNEHVVRGASGRPTVTTIDGRKLALGAFEIAEGADLVRFKLEGFEMGLRIRSDDIKLGEHVMIFGNSDGYGVATAISGYVVGVGPDVMEVSAEFVHGNSGSPVVTIEGVVIGVATYAVNAKNDKDWVKRDTLFNGVRRFAIRLSNVRWKPMDWETYATIVNR